VPRPDKDLADALATALGAGFARPPAAGANVFHGPVRPFGTGVPHKAIFCGPGAASPPVRQFRGGEIRRAAVQIRSRADVGDFEASELLARSVWDAIEFATIAGYIQVQAVDSEPVSLGQDDQEHWEFVVNVELQYYDA